MKNSKLYFQLLILCVYLVAFIAGYLVYLTYLNSGILFATLMADIIATIIVWLIGVIIRNSSIYDPYWSIAPPVILICWLIARGQALDVTEILMLIAIMTWSIRLTYNWVKRFQGFDDQDWRYIMLKEKSPKMWLITNFFGINMMPTLIVFAAMVPMYSIVFNEGNLSTLTIIGFVFALTAVALQYYSDTAMEKHRNSDEKGIIRVGLWKLSRHPNYLGEVLLWWSIFIMQLGYNMILWPNIIGAIAMNSLFVFISIPMMEKYISDKYDDYEEYKKSVPMLLPIKLKK